MCHQAAPPKAELCVGGIEVLSDADVPDSIASSDSALFAPASIPQGAVHAHALFMSRQEAGTIGSQTFKLAVGSPEYFR